MRPVFQILPDSINTSNKDLICEISESGFAYFLQDYDTKFIQGLSVYHFDKINGIDSLTNTLQKIFDNDSTISGPFRKTTICYSFKESILIPESIHQFEAANESLTVVYGEMPASIVRSENIPGTKIHNIYRISEEVHQAITKYFPTAAVIHQYTALSHTENEISAMTAIFYPNKIITKLIKEGALQIIQSYNYSCPEDVVYYMLNICHQFSVEVVTLNLGGMIEKDSAMYDEIHKYFKQINFLALGADVAEGIKEFPAHYFGHLFLLSSCE